MLCKNLNLKLIAIFSILLSCFNLMADDVTFTINAPETVEVGEKFRVQFMLNVDGGDFFEINIADFKIISGPTKSSSNNIQWVNGQMLKKTTSTFSLILMAEYEGKYTIPSATIKYNGKNYQSNPASITVLATSPNNSSTNNKQQSTVSSERVVIDYTNEKNEILEKLEREQNQRTQEFLKLKSQSNNNSLLSEKTSEDYIERRYDPHNKSKYDDEISWTFDISGSNDVEDLRAEVREKHIKSISLTIGVIILLMALIILIIKSRR